MFCKKLLVFFILTVFSSYVYAQKNEVISFELAYIDGDSVQFESPFAIDWQSLSPPDLRQLETNFDNPTNKKRIIDRRYFYGLSEFPYWHRSLPEDYKSYSVHFLASSGIHNIEPSHLRGVVRFDTDIFPNQDTTLNWVSYLGYVIAPTAPEKVSGGFVFASTDKNSPVTATTDYSPQELLGKSEMSEREQAFWQIQTQYAFQIDAVDYVFVAWVGDDDCYEGCCQNRFTLFKKEQSFQVLKESYFACDI